LNCIEVYRKPEEGNLKIFTKVKLNQLKLPAYADLEKKQPASRLGVVYVPSPLAWIAFRALRTVGVHLRWVNHSRGFSSARVGPSLLGGSSRNPSTNRGGKGGGAGKREGAGVARLRNRPRPRLQKTLQTLTGGVEPKLQTRKGSVPGTPPLP
jgi:hypothetical protein